MKITRADQQQNPVEAHQSAESRQDAAAKDGEAVETVQSQTPADKAQDGKPMEVAAVVPQQRPDAAEQAALAKPQPEQQQASDAEWEKADTLREEIEKQISGITGKLSEGLVVTPAEGGLLLPFPIRPKRRCSMSDRPCPGANWFWPWKRSANCFRSGAAAS